MKVPPCPMMLCFSVNEQLAIQNISLNKFFFCFHTGASPECFQKSKYLNSELIPNFLRISVWKRVPNFLHFPRCSSCFITPKHTTLWEPYSKRWDEEAHEPLILPFLGGYYCLRELLDPVWKIWQHLVVRIQMARISAFFFKNCKYKNKYRATLKQLRPLKHG